MICDSIVKGNFNLQKYIYSHLYSLGHLDFEVYLVFRVVVIYGTILFFVVTFIFGFVSILGVFLIFGFVFICEGVFVFQVTRLVSYAWTISQGQGVIIWSKSLVQMCQEINV